jgi:two-component system sensor histidine kinase VicK
MNIVFLTAGIAGLGLLIGIVWIWLKHKGGKNESIVVSGGLAISPKVLKDQRWKPDFILSAIQDGVVMVGSDNQIQLLNPAASDITGWPPKEALGLDFHNVLSIVNQKGEPCPPESHPFRQALLSGQVVRDNNSSLANRNGKNVAISLIVSPVISTERGVESVVGVFRDVSKEKAEEAARSDFISTASHEMRTPIAAIEGYLALSLNPKTATIDDNARNLLEKASTSTKHLGELFRDLLTSSKAEDGRLISYPAVIEAGEMLEQVAETSRFHAKEKGLELDYKISAEQDISGGKAIRPLYYAYVDPNRIREVFQNIIDNAIKYTNEGKVEVRLTGDTNITQIQVKDTGPGIPAEDIPHLFQKFYRVDNSTTRTVGGTGLGLFICRKIVELYNGRIWVESEWNKGSTFYINLPRLNAQQALEIQKKQSAMISPLDQHP